MTQQIRYAPGSDDVNIAWARVGGGRPLVKAACWLSHLQYDSDSPVWRHWIEFFGSHFQFIRYDERGSGMSDCRIGKPSLGQWIDDFERVVTAAQLQQPFVVLGIGHGAAIAIGYAVRHPQRVSHLILYGGYALGGNKNPVDAAQKAFYRSLIEVIRTGWGLDNPIFRQLFTSRYLPQGTKAQIDWFNELCLRAASVDNASKLLSARGDVDVRDCLRLVRPPTLVMHSSRDQIVPFSQGTFLAANIPNASFVQIDSENHILQKHEPGWQQFQNAVLHFLGHETSYPGFHSDAMLTDRERTMLAMLCDGCGNAQIASGLGIADKTVRNHISNLYRKLGVRTRTQAIALANRRMQSR